MTSQEGFEPPTVRLEGECSIQLSYYDKFLTTGILYAVKQEMSTKKIKKCFFIFNLDNLKVNKQLIYTWTSEKVTRQLLEIGLAIR